MLKPLGAPQQQPAECGRTSASCISLPAAQDATRHRRLGSNHWATAHELNQPEATQRSCRWSGDRIHLGGRDVERCEEDVDGLQHSGVERMLACGKWVEIDGDYWRATKKMCSSASSDLRNLRNKPNLKSDWFDLRENAARHRFCTKRAKRV